MRFIFSLIILQLLHCDTKAQGCVAIKSTGVVCSFQNNKMAGNNHWEFSLNNRYFRSFRHFVGSDEQKQRVAMGTQVINYSYTADVALQYSINERWAVSVDVPILSNLRSSLYEHDGKHRNNTSSFGLGDARLSASRWMINPAANKKFSLQLGAGIKIPTGNYKVLDQFFANDSTVITGPVDQSIQLGDGGWGLTGTMNAWYEVSKKIQLFGNFYYLLNPKEVNGVSTSRGRVPGASSIANGSNVMSVPDQYMLRAGMNYKAGKFIFSAGLRHECLPVHDLIGGSNGFRRPGYILSAEPGISYSSGRTNFYANMPVALKRNRLQSVPDKIRTELTGTFTKGDAAFADRTLNIGCSIRF